MTKMGDIIIYTFTEICSMYWLLLPLGAVTVIGLLNLIFFVQYNQWLKKLKGLAESESKEAIDWFDRHY